MSESDPGILHGLECALVEPGLRSILIFDCPSADLLATAEILTGMWEGLIGRAVGRVTLGPTSTEEELWGTMVPRQEDGRTSWQWRPNRLAQVGSAAGPRLVLIPDLARLSLPAARACVSLMGDAVGVLQRRGQNTVWRPDLCWLAGCARAEVGEISPHLLDRFALRLPFRPQVPVDRAADIRKWILPDLGLKQDLDLLSTNQHVHRACAALAPRPSPAALKRAVTYFVDAQGTTRREIALIRLARAISRLDGREEVTASHVDQAARLLDLRFATAEPAPLETALLPGEGATTHPETAGDLLPAEHATAEGSVAKVDETDTTIEEPVYRADAEVAFDPAPLPPGPYPEDAALPAREANSLRLPTRRYRASTATEGPAIGTRPATEVCDLAILQTVIEAVKYQQFRRRRCPDRQGLIITRADLRSYRRTPLPEQILALLLDYTSLHSCDWQEAVLPHLTWAYTARASICLIQVGARGARNRLRAEQVLARNLLSPFIAAALSEAPGFGTPLAHGLDLATRLLRNRLHHGRGRLQRARLVILSDGRGNVPLAASRAGRLLSPVGREGVDDALCAATSLRDLNHVDRFYLNPQPRQHAELPVALGEALGAFVQLVPLLSQQADAP